MSVHVCLALLALSSLTAAFPSCQELLNPLKDQSRVNGKWIFQAGTSDNEDLLEELKKINSSWIEITPVSDSDEMSLRWADKVDGKCIHGNTNYNFTGNGTKVTFHFNSTIHEHEGLHLATCPDCIVWTDTSVTKSPDRDIKKGRNLYFFTRNGTLENSQLEVFKRQAACLNFPPDFHFGETTDLCPEAENTKEDEQ